MSQEIAMIAACAENRAIGKNNGLMWHMPKDLKFFKEKTRGHHVIMGRKTFETFEGSLPKRTNIIVTRRKDYEAPYENCLVVHSMDEGLQHVDDEDPEPFIVGGEQIYRIGMDLAHRLYITWIHASFDGDAYFPEIGDEWVEVEREEHPADDRHKYPYSFVTYERKGE